MADDKPTTPTRRRALAALAGITAAAAVPAAAGISTGDPDAVAEIQRLYDAIIAQGAEIERASLVDEANLERAHAHYPPEPELPPLPGLTAEQIMAMTFSEQSRRSSEHHAANEKITKEWQRECKRIHTEHGCDEEAVDEAMDRLTELRDELAETRARTPRGVLLKLRAAVAMELGNLDDGFQYSNPVVVSVIDDMEAIAGGDDAA